MRGMGSETQELIRICEELPEAERAELADFARFLLAKQQDEAWDRSLADPQPRAKLEAFVRSALAEGAGPLDPDKL